MFLYLPHNGSEKHRVAQLSFPVFPVHVEIINYYLHPVAQNEKKKTQKWLTVHSI